LKILWGEAKLCAALPDRRGVALRDLQPTSRTRLDYRHNSKKGQAWNKCALLTRGKPSNRRKLRILLHSFPAGFTSQACNSPPLIWPDTGSGGFFDRTRRLCSLARAKGSAVFSPNTGWRVEASQRRRYERGALALGGSRLKSRDEQFCSDLRSLVCYATTNGIRNWGAADDSKAMTYLSRHERRTKAMAEVLAIIAGAYPELAPDRPDSDREAEEWLWEIASGFCAALDRYAARTMQVKREHY